MDELVRTEVADGVATLTLANPPLNLVTLALTRRLGEVLDGLEADPAARVLVLRGEGERAFSAGSDIKEFGDLQAPGAVLERKLIKENQVYSQVADFPKPTVAVVQGLAFGGGLELAVCCDLIVTETTARFALPEIKLGVFPGSGGTVRVARRIGAGRARQMIYLGEPIDAATALAWGLVDQVAEPGQAPAAARELAARLAAMPNRALQLAKHAIDLAFDVTEAEAVERTLELSGEVFTTDDAREGAAAFLAKRQPHFRHR